MKMTVIPIVNGMPGTIHKRLVNGLEDLKIRGHLETIPTTALLRSARILRGVLKARGELVKSVTLVEGDPKAPFSIATTPRCRGGRYSFPWIAPL